MPAEQRLDRGYADPDERRVVERRGLLRALAPSGGKVRAAAASPAAGDQPPSPDPPPASRLARYFAVLAEPTRLEILMLLGQQPWNVTELVLRVGGGQSRVSNHLACLRRCGFVTATRRGRQITYRLADPDVGEMIALAAEAMSRHDQLGSCPELD